MNASIVNARATATAVESKSNGNTSHRVEENIIHSPKWKTRHIDRFATANPAASPTSKLAKIKEIKMHPADHRRGILKKHTTPKSMSNTETKRTRKVRFHQGNNKKHSEVNVQVIHIEMIKSQRLKSKLWYTSKDISSMLERDATILSLMDMGYTDEMLVNTDSKAALLLSKYSQKEIEELTTRGLERQTKKGIQRFQMTSRASIAAVLQCQHSNRGMHQYYRMECIASVYALTTRESQLQSLHRAKQDAKFVRDYCNIHNYTMDLLRQLQPQVLHGSNNGNSKKSLSSTTTSLFSLFQRPTANVTANMGQ